MTELLLLDWDDHQVRALAGSQTGDGLRVHRLTAAPLEGELSSAIIAEALRPLVAEMRSHKGNLAVLLGGRFVQSRLLRVPPVPDDELPDLVRLRAGTEFPAAEEPTIIDYFPLARSDEEPQPVFVTRVGEQVMTQVREVCQKLHLTPQHVGMRGAGIATFAVQHAPELESGVHLLVVRRHDELDLIGTRDGAAAVVRTVPLPADAEGQELARCSVRELRRTLAAVSTELAVGEVQSICWITGDEQDLQLATQTGRDLGRTVDILEVPKLVQLTSQEQVEWPEQCASFAGMLGTAVAVAHKALPLDFLAPRQAKVKKTPTTTLALAGTLVAAVLLMGGWLLYSQVAAIEQEAADYLAEREEAEAEIERLAPERAQAEQIERWLATDVNWLDEIDRLALTLRPEPLDNHDEFEPDRDAMLLSLAATRAPGARASGGTISLSGVVRDEAVLQQIEEELRDPTRRVNPQGIISDNTKHPYVWNFRADVLVDPTQEETQ